MAQTGRIPKIFSELKQNSKKALIPFVTAGDPNKETTLPLMHAMVEAGADIIELGIPFSDPMADGPVIQLANERALAHNTGLTDIFAIVKAFRQTNQHTAVVLMGYLNPIEWMGYESFAQQAASAGIDGALVVDLPPEEAKEYTEIMQQYGLDTVYLITPTTTALRVKSICEKSTGYVYYVSLKGVTGSAALDVQSVAEQTQAIRSQTDLPVAVGFGIKNGETAAAVAAVSDGVIVGSVLVNLIADNQNANCEQICSQVTSVLANMRENMDAQ